MKVPITPEIMKKVWKLHENRLDDSNVIAEIIGISEASVRRIIQIMTAAKKGISAIFLFRSIKNTRLFSKIHTILS